MSIGVYMCLKVSKGVYMFLYVSICVYVCVCVDLCVFVCICILCVYMWLYVIICGVVVALKKKIPRKRTGGAGGPLKKKVAKEDPRCVFVWLGLRS